MLSILYYIVLSIVCIECFLCEVKFSTHLDKFVSFWEDFHSTKW